MTPYKFTLAAGSVERTWDVDFDYFHVLEAPINDLMVRFDDGAPVNLKQGVGMRIYGSRFTLASVTGQLVTVLAGFGHVADARATANVNVTANMAPGNLIGNGGDVACAAGAATLLLAQDLTRLYALIKNVSANTVTVRIGDATVGVASGVPVEPGETLPYGTTAAIYAYNPGPGAITLSASSVKQ